MRAFDDPQDLSKPRGKQDWHREPHSIWYYRTTGIWQTVWMEIVPQTRIESLRWTPRMDTWSFELHATIAGPISSDSRLRLRVKLRTPERELTSDIYSVSNREVTRTITLPDGGIDDFRSDLLWSPSRPNLVNADVELLDENGRVLDSVQSYTAMRSVSAQGDRAPLDRFGIRDDAGVPSSRGGDRSNRSAR